MLKKGGAPSVEKTLGAAVIVKRILASVFWTVILTGILFGVAFIVGIFLYIFAGSDAVLKFMADILSRILEIKKYF
jgi:hypothetical protein